MDIRTLAFCIEELGFCVAVSSPKISLGHENVNIRLQEIKAQKR